MFNLFKLLTISTLLIGCGEDYKVIKIKDYKLSIFQGEESDFKILEDLINRYNQDVGRHVLSFERSPASANAPVKIMPSLREVYPEASSDPAGVGSSYVITKTEHPLVEVTGRKAKMWMKHFMELFFQQDIFRSNNPQLVYRLFCHEVGHGLEMDHNRASRHEVMYPYLYDDPETDFNSYFEHVRQYMDDIN